MIKPREGLSAEFQHFSISGLLDMRKQAQGDSAIAPCSVMDCVPLNHEPGKNLFMVRLLLIGFMSLQ